MQELTELLNKVLDQASYFLKEYGEFYPFAIVLRADGTLQPFNVYEGEEHPSPAEYLKELEKVLRSGYDQYDYNSFAIGINATATKNGKKTDVIQIKLNYQGEDYENSFVPYEIKNGSVELYDMYTE